MERIAALAAGVADRTDSERQGDAAVELERLEEHKVVQILQQPGADTGCTVVWQGVALVVAMAETALVVRVAVAVAVAAAAAAVVVAAAAAAIESFASHHSHSLHTERTAQAEGGVVRALVPAPAQMAIVDYTAAVEVELLLLP